MLDSIPRTAGGPCGASEISLITTQTTGRTQSDFSSFQLSQNVLRGVEAAGYDEPRPIQTQSIGAILDGRDLLGLAQTGTGKTAAFVLPILERCLARKAPGPRALVVAPTRELALQIHGEFETLGKFTNIKSTVVFGGVGQKTQVTALRRRPDVIVACPGRLLDLYGQGVVDFGNIEVLVLDEADHMFDMGFLPDIRRILKALPERRQNLLFSATMPREIRGLADKVLHSPKLVELAHSSPADTIEHALYPVREDQKQDALEALIDAPGFRSAIIFLRTKHRAKRMALKLSKLGHKAVALQGNMSQNQREKAMKGFRGGTYDILVATDIAARGIDVANVSHVINFDVPNTPDAYVHRIGRTGRSEQEGKACTLITHEDKVQVRAIEKRIGFEIERRGIEGVSRVKERPGKGPARPPSLDRDKPRSEKKPAQAPQRREREERPRREERPARPAPKAQPPRTQPPRTQPPRTQPPKAQAAPAAKPPTEDAAQPFGAGVDADAERNAARKETRRRRESEREADRKQRPDEAPAGPGARRRRSNRRSG